jgi:hypothetical protein
MKSKNNSFLSLAVSSDSYEIKIGRTFVAE